MKATRALSLFLTLALLALVLLPLPISSAHAADPMIVRVQVNGATSGVCGSTWATACGLSYALTSFMGSGYELWVAAGTYTPTTGTDRTASFRLRNGFALYGGFAGTETARSQRNYATNVTILSGDIGTPSKSSDNAYHVVTGSGVTNTAVLDGFTITGGWANGAVYPDDSGGGMYNDGGSPTLANLIFSGNSAKFYGGGMDNYNGSNPTLTNITFSNNSSPTANGGGMVNEYGSNPTLTNVLFSGNSSPTGGGMYNWISNPTLADVVFSTNTGMYGGGLNNDSSNPTLTNVTFSGNTASQTGGGMRSVDSSPILTNVRFISNTASDGGGMYSEGGSPRVTDATFMLNLAGNGSGMYNSISNPAVTNATFMINTASTKGGGIYNNGSSPSLTNVTFSGNQATNSGGGMYSDYSSTPTLTNTTFVSNTASTNGGGMANYNGSSPTIYNTIVWGNNAPSGPQIYDDSSTPNLSDSVVQGGYAGGTNIITADPHLGGLGSYGGSTQTIPLLSGSSAIDAGNDATCAATDQRGVRRPQGAHCDIGAFEAVWMYFPLLRR